MARLSTHVLDTSRGAPAPGVTVQLYRLQRRKRVLLATAITNVDGRTDEPLLSGESLDIGVYELVFQAGDYFRSDGSTPPEPLFLDEIVVRFGIAEATGNYHVPLLLTPFGYSTYRGS